VKPSLASAAANILKLEIGSGEHPCEGGFTHNDVVAYPHIELVGDGARLFDLPGNTVRIVRAMHVLEHFDIADGVSAIQEWRRLLVPDGILELALPNGELIVRLWEQGQITYEAMIRDMQGLPPARIPVPTEAAFRKAWAKHGGWSYRFKRWLYDPTMVLPRGNPEAAQTHRWAYSAGELQRLLTGVGFCRVHVKIDGTAFHAWGSKEPVREAESGGSFHSNTNPTTATLWWHWDEKSLERAFRLTDADCAATTIVAAGKVKEKV
jgi:SAM-dependent methyltransferase